MAHRRRAASAEVWRSSLKRYVFPKLGRKPVSDITTADVLGVIVPIWRTKTATARRVKGRISSIMRWAIAQNYIENNPASDAVEAALPRDTTPQQHHRALPYREVGTALRTVRESNASPATKLLFAFVTLTASRSGEARLARWSEVDLEGRAWTVPADRMKAKREHRVPLASRAMEVLTEARRLADDSGLIFPSTTGRGPLGANTLTKLSHELRLGCTPHGARSPGPQEPDDAPSFSESVADQTYMVGDSVSLTLPPATGGNGSLIYSLAPKIPGLWFFEDSRELRGRPRVLGKFRMTYQAEDTDSNTAESDAATLTFTVDFNLRLEAACLESRPTPTANTFRDCDVCPEMLDVPTGSFMMGYHAQESTQPVHEVTISDPFAVGVYEVAFAEWDACLASGGVRGICPQ